MKRKSESSLNDTKTHTKSNIQNLGKNQDLYENVKTVTTRLKKA